VNHEFQIHASPNLAGQFLDSPFVPILANRNIPGWHALAHQAIWNSTKNQPLD
jgi:hypothetical protein